MPGNAPRDIYLYLFSIMLTPLQKKTNPWQREGESPCSQWYVVHVCLSCCSCRCWCGSCCCCYCREGDVQTAFPFFSMRSHIPLWFISSCMNVQKCYRRRLYTHAHCVYCVPWPQRHTQHAKRE